MFDWLNKLLPVPEESGNAPASGASGKELANDTAPPDESAAHLRRGNEFLAQGQLQEAAGCYRQAIALKPGVADGHLNLGFVLHELQHNEEARIYLIQALRFNSELEDAYYLLGKIAQEQNNLADAIENYNKALELKPDFETVYRDLCQCLLQAGQPGAARHLIEQGVSVFPDSVDFHYFLGNSAVSEKEPAKAIPHFLKILSVQPGNAVVHFLLGDACLKQGDLNEAISHYRKALELQPDYVDAYINLGAAFQQLGDLDEAMACFRKALTLQPDSAIVNNNLGVICKETGRLDEAVTFFRSALALKPDFAESLNNLGSILNVQGNIDEAIAYYRKALSLNPDLAMAKLNLGKIFQAQNKLDQAITCYRGILASSPYFLQAKINLLPLLQQVCDWKDLASGSEEIRRTVRESPPTEESLVRPFSLLTLPGTTSEEQRICATKWVQCEFQSQISSREQMGFVFKRESKPKIHVGYFSTDVRNHPVAQLMAEVFELHDRDRFKITAYSYGPDDGSAMRKRLENAFDHFVDLHDSTDEHMARKIYDDQTDILVDLTGYTHSSRSRILAWRPAPVQVSYIGYLGTMGGDFMDYIIADPFLIPPEDQKYYTEKVAYLPSYQANDRQCLIAETPSRKACGLPEQGVVFCCFNQTYKILPDVFEVWMRLLSAVPGSVLWLYASNPHAIGNLRREAHARSVSPERLIFADLLPLDQHLARLKCADLFLDTLPYNAGTTASNALWVGLPVITCTGKTFSSRMAGSLLTAMGLPELITYNLDDYYALALDLASNRDRRENIRDKIIANRDLTPLFDSKLFTRNLESAYEKMWNEYANEPAG